MAVPNIVIIGGGAAGLELAIRLGKSLGVTGQAVIHLVDRNLTQVWKPLWHEVAAGTLNNAEAEVNYLNLAFNHNFNFHLGRFKAIERQARQVVIEPVWGADGELVLPERQLVYDYLIVAIGSVHNDFKIAGVSENCYFLDSLQESLIFQQRLMAKLLTVHEQLRRLPQIVIVGGGATGIELASELDYALRQHLIYAKLTEDDFSSIKIAIIESNSRILMAMPEAIAVKVKQQITKQGITIYCQQKVRKVTPQQVITVGGLHIDYDLCVWAAGIQAPELLANLGLKVDQSNRIMVNQQLQSLSDPAIYALGDCAACSVILESQQKVPATAQAAHQQARWLASWLIDKIGGRQNVMLFAYREYGALVSLRHTRGLGYLKGLPVQFKITLRGKLASLAYRWLYRRYQAILFGWGQTVVLMLTDKLLSKVKPRLKLH